MIPLKININKSCSDVFLSCLIDTCARSYTVKPVLNGHSKINKTKVLMTNGSLMKVESIAECSPWSILQYFCPALSNNWSYNPIFGLFESGHFTQVYCIVIFFLKEKI